MTWEGGINDFPKMTMTILVYYLVVLLIITVRRTSFQHYNEHNTLQAVCSLTFTAAVRKDEISSSADLSLSDQTVSWK